jgi:tetratricopeptide (TPR) repeat protein
MRAGRLAEAQRVIGQARALDPASPMLEVLEARIAYYDRRYEHAREQLLSVLERERSFPAAHYYLALCESYLGLTDEAEEHMKRVGMSEAALAVETAWVQARAQQPEAGKLLLNGSPRNSTVPLVAGELGYADTAFRMLEEGLDQRWPVLLAMQVDPRFDPLRADPRFQRLARRAGIQTQ